MHPFPNFSTDTTYDGTITKPNITEYLEWPIQTRHVHAKTYLYTSTLTSVTTCSRAASLGRGISIFLSSRPFASERWEETNIYKHSNAYWAEQRGVERVGAVRGHHLQHNVSLNFIWGRRQQLPISPVVLLLRIKFRIQQTAQLQADKHRREARTLVVCLNVPVTILTLPSSSKPSSWLRSY